MKKLKKNKDNYLEKYIRPQWTWRTYLFLISLSLVLFLITLHLEINFFLLFSDSLRYFSDILGRMLPPDFSNLKELIFSMI